MDIFIFLFLPPSENKNLGNKSKQPNVDFSGCFYTSFFIYLCFIIVLIIRFRYFQSIKYFLNEKCEFACLVSCAKIWLTFVNLFERYALMNRHRSISKVISF